MTVAKVPGDWTQGVRYVLPHRIAYEEWVGPIPAGLVIDHLCNVPACVNPDHLTLNTTVGNVMRGQGAGAKNARKTHCKRNHPLSGENLLTYEWNGHTWRACRTCRRMQWRVAS